MSITILKTPLNLKASLNGSNCSAFPSKYRSFHCVSFVNRRLNRCRLLPNLKLSNGVSGVDKLKSRLVHFEVFVSGDGESAEAQTETQTREPVEDSNEWGNVDGSVGFEDSSINGESTDVEGSGSTILAYLKIYKEALASNEESKVTEVESFFKTFEEEKFKLEQKLVTLTEELSYEKDRVLRISADFDNFRKRTERERLSLVTNAQGEVVENLVPVLDNFERAKAQIKIGSEAEEKISNSYQSIYKQFVEILDSFGVTTVETVGKPFDPMLHEAIMREDSEVYDEGVVIEEYRKGFKLGDRLLRPSMVKVSSGTSASKHEPVESKEAESVEETEGHAATEPESAEE